MVSIFLIIFFIVSRVFLNSLWEQISVYYSYLYELLFVIGVFFYVKNKQRTKFKFKIDFTNFLRLLPWPFLGFFIYQLAVKAQIIIPFDFRPFEIKVMLLLIAPILEELIYRYALWELFDNLTENNEIKIWFSSIMFSIGHLLAMFMIGPEFRPFVLYQAIYVVVLSIACSKIRIETKSILSSILLHFLFNLGFYFGSLVAFN